MTLRPRATSIEGSFAEDRREGQGNISTRPADGYVYTGSWVAGKIEGDGQGKPTRRFSQRRRSFSAMIVATVSGKITYPDGSTYEDHGRWRPRRRRPSDLSQRQSLMEGGFKNAPHDGPRA